MHEATTSNDRDHAVTASTGKTGRRVTAQLRARGLPVRELARRTPTPFDWRDEATWPAALAGVRSVYVVVPHLVDDPVERTARLAQLLRETGVERQVLLSARGVGLPGTEGYAAVEEAAASTGVATTILRPSWFAQNFTEDLLAPHIRRGVLRLPAGDLRDPFIDVGDIAEVAAVAMTEPGFTPRTIELSGPRTLSFREAGDVIGAALGSPVAYEEVTPEVLADQMAADGRLPAEIPGLVAIFDLLRDGLSAHLSDGVQQVLGRAPRDFAAFAADAAASGVWGRSAAA